MCGLTHFLKIDLPHPFDGRSVEESIFYDTTISIRLFEHSNNSYGELEQQDEHWFF